MAAATMGLETRQLTGSKNLAILVIHGIGEQNPYETLDGFARGLHQYYREQFGASPNLRAERIEYSHGSRTCVHLEPPRDCAGALRQISLFEYYWAPETEDKISYRDSLLFLVRTGIRPLRDLSTNLQEIFSAAKKPSIWRAAGMLMREIYRAVLIFIPLIVALGVLGWWLANPPSLSDTRSLIVGVLCAKPWWATAVFTVCSVMSVVLASFLVREIGSLVRRRGASIEKYAEWSWLVVAVAFLVLFTWVGRAIFHSYVEVADAVVALVWRRKTAAVLLTLAAVYVIK